MKGRRLYDEGGVVATTILQQLGGAGRLRMMTGAYNFLDLKNGLSFRIKNQRANYVKITLTSMDLYDVEVGRIRGDQYKVVAESKGMYNEQLKPFIEKATGMYLSLAKGGDIDDAPMSDHQMKNYLIEKGISTPAMVNGKYCEYWEDAAEHLGFVRNDAGWEEEEDADFDEIHDAAYFDEGDEDENWDDEDEEDDDDKFAKGGEISESDISKFVDYVYSFYGVEDGIYKDDDDLNGGATKEEITEAVKMYIADLSVGKDGMEWGEGDSIDRERIRVYLGKRNFNHEIVVVAKGLEKDGGQIIRDRFLVNADSEDEAKSIARDMWMKDMGNSDFSITEVLTDKEYRDKYFEKGGIVRYVEKGDYKDNLYFRRYNKAIGSFAWIYKEGSKQKYNEGILYALDEFDREFYSHLKLKDGETLFRYRTDIMMKDDKYLIKINVERALIYFMINWEDDKNPEFSTKGVKADYIVLERNSFAKGGEVKVGDVLTATTGVKVKVIEYDPKFGGRVKVERMDEYSDGKPSQFMPLSRFKFAIGGMPMTAGKYYRDADGGEFRFIGDANGMGLFTDKDGKGVKKDYSDFSKAPKETKLFGWFAEGGTIEDYKRLEQRLDYLTETLSDTEDDYDRKRINSEISSIHSKMAKLEDKDKMADGGELKIRFDLYGYEDLNNKVQDGDTIIRVESYSMAEKKAKDFLYDNNYMLVEVYRKDELVGSIKHGEKFVYSKKYMSKHPEFNNVMANGGMVKKRVFFKLKSDDEDRFNQFVYQTSVASNDNLIPELIDVHSDGDVVLRLDLDEPTLQKFKDADFNYSFELPKKGGIQWGEDLGSGYSVGDNVKIKSSGEEGFLIGKDGKDFVVRISKDLVDTDIKLPASKISKANMFAKGGEIKWQDVEVGDSARVKEINKTGLIMQAYGRKFHLKFPDDTEKTYDAKELEFFKDEEFGKGGITPDNLKKVEGSWQSYHSGILAGKKDDGYVSIRNEEDLMIYLTQKLGNVVKNISVVELGKNYPYNRSNPYFYDTYLVELIDGNKFQIERSYGRPNWFGNVDYIESIKVKDEEFGKGGKVKKKRVRFVDKVNSIAERLEGSKVPKRLRKDYGIKYNQMEAEEAGRRIAGAQLRDRKK